MLKYQQAFWYWCLRGALFGS